MTQEIEKTILDAIPGAAELRTWFGCWPGFHDAEIRSLILNRDGTSVLSIHTWQMTKQADERGYFVSDKHVLVHFRIEEIFALKLDDFSEQNVVSGLSLSPVENGFEFALHPCFGLAGSIAARKLTIDFQPMPTATH